MKSKTTALLLAMLMIAVPLSTITVFAASQTPAPKPMFAGGDGSIGEPYQISNVTELQWMGNVSNLDKNFTLINDIDASATSGWNWNVDHFDGFDPIGDNTNKFTGSLDGQSFNITGLFINRSEENYVGLFGYLDTENSVSNISLVNNNLTGGDYVGGLVGWNDGGTVTNCYATGNVSGNGTIGGLMGLNDGPISNSYATGSVNGTDVVGGLVGENFAVTITNCYTTGSVSGSDWSVGGLVGWNSGTVSNSYATGSVSGTCWNVGGLVGRNNGGTISNSYATGSISGDGWVGGLVGRNTGMVSNSYVTGNVSGDDWVGGLVGRNDAPVSNSYATGIVSGSSNVGGFVGFNSGTVSNSYATGSVSGSFNVGGFVGFNNVGTVANCFWDNETSGWTTSAGGAGKSTEEMMSIYTFLIAGWDFGNIWDIRHTHTYSFFKYENRNYAPIANDDNYGTSEDGILSIPADGVLGNDEEWEFEPLTLTQFDNPSVQGAAVNVIADGSFTYDPTGVPGLEALAVGEYMVDTFTYTISDGTSTDTATVSVNVTGVNDAPTANDDYKTTNEDTVLNIAAPGVLGNDTDPDASDVLSALADTLTTANGARVIINADGSYAYDPASAAALQAVGRGEYLIDTFSYTASDGNGGMDTATISINITGVNDVPMITTADIEEAVVGQAYSVDYEVDDLDASDTLTWGLTTNATWLGIDSATGVINGPPAAGVFYANISVDDGNNGTDWNNFTLTVHSDIDGDGTPDFIDPDFLTTTEYNNQTVYSNNTIWQNRTIDGSEDTDGDGWSDAEEILAGTDPDDGTDVPADSDSDGIADFMDPEEPAAAVETPAWAWCAVIAAVVMGILAAIGFMRGGGGKPEIVEETPEPEIEKPSEPEIES